MKLTEARYQGDEQVVVLINDLPYSERLDFSVEDFGPPAIDSRTGAVLLSYDMLDSKYAESGTLSYDEEKHVHPWQAEIAGTEKQILNFIHIYFPTWSTDKSISDHITTMWDRASIARAAAAAEQHGTIIESASASDQVMKILEAKYAKEYTAFEAFERYEALVKNDRVHGNVILDDREYGETNGQCYAQLWGWIQNVETEEEAKRDAAHFAREVDVPYTGIEIDDHPEPFGKRMVFVTWLYVQDCPGAGDPLAEARYYKQMTASEVYDRMEDVLDYTKHVVDTPVIGIIDFGLSRINHAIEDSPEVAEVEMLVQSSDKDRAIALAKEFLDSKGIPYHDITAEYANPDETYVAAQWVDPITEARTTPPREFSDNDLYQVAQMYKKYESLVGTGADPFIQVTPQFYGGRIVPRLETWHDKRNWREDEAEQHAIAFMKANRLPYTQRRFRDYHYGGVDYYITKFRFGHPRDQDKLVG
jgi:hypothetical protein